MMNEGLNITDFEQFMKNLENARYLMAYFECAVMEIETKFKVLNTQFSVQQDYNPIETIKTRVKSPESIIGKMKRKILHLVWKL